MNGRAMHSLFGTHAAPVPAPAPASATLFDVMHRKLMDAHADVDPLDTTRHSFNSPSKGRASVMLLGGSSPVISEKLRCYMAPESESNGTVAHPEGRPAIGSSLGGLAVHVTTTRLTLEEGEIVVSQREMRPSPAEDGSIDPDRSTGNSKYQVLEGEIRANEINRIARTVIAMT